MDKEMNRFSQPSSMNDDYHEKTSNKQVSNDGKYSFNNWDELDVNINLLRGINGYGFSTPSPIQQKSIIPMLNNKDVIAQAQSGTGKTGAFSIGALGLVDDENSEPQVLIISPTRELSKQTYSVVDGISTPMKNIRKKLLIGGTDTQDDIKDIEENKPQILVGCPGRLFELLRRNVVNGKLIKLIVLDEADEMLSGGFKEQIYNVFQYLNTNVQVALFSATLPDELKALTNKFMRDPIEIYVQKDQLTLEGILQYHISLDDDYSKYATLKDLFQKISISQCIIYANSIKRVSDLYDAMTADGFPVCRIHSGMSKEDRDEAYISFKEGKFRVLISTNLTARGIDIHQVSTVINFDVPKDIHTYIHRIGRSGRWGKKGMGINFVTRRDYRKIKDIEKYYSTIIPPLPENFAKI